jgi:hypothetical protein
VAPALLKLSNRENGTNCGQLITFCSLPSSSHLFRDKHEADCDLSIATIRHAELKLD